MLNTFISLFLCIDDGWLKFDGKRLEHTNMSPWDCQLEPVMKSQFQHSALVSTFCRPRIKCYRIINKICWIASVMTNDIEPTITTKHKSI